VNAALAATTKAVSAKLQPELISATTADSAA
jgi:hypothetical protein